MKRIKYYLDGFYDFCFKVTGLTDIHTVVLTLLSRLFNTACYLLMYPANGRHFGIKWTSALEVIALL